MILTVVDSIGGCQVTALAVKIVDRANVSSPNGLLTCLLYQLDDDDVNVFRTCCAAIMWSIQGTVHQKIKIQ